MMKTLKDIKEYGINEMDEADILMHNGLSLISLLDLKDVVRECIKELGKGDYLNLSNGLPETDTNSIIFKSVDKKALILVLEYIFNLEGDKDEIKNE